MHGKIRHARCLVMGCWDVQHTVYVLRVPKDVFQIEDAEKVLQHYITSSIYHSTKFGVDYWDSHDHYEYQTGAQ